jgi:hypothetical protein
MGEVATRPDRTAQLGIQRRYGVGNRYVDRGACLVRLGWL